MTNEPKYVRYPTVSLGDAVIRLKTVYDNVGTKALDRVMLAQKMGYNSRNGASDAVAAAFAHYGLIDDMNKVVKISRPGLEIVSGEPGETLRVAALEIAALAPSLFAELHNQYGDSSIAHRTLVTFLMRNGFNPPAADKAAKVYSDTMDFVAQERALRDTDLPDRNQEEERVQTNQRPAHEGNQPNHPPVANNFYSVDTSSTGRTWLVPIDENGRSVSFSIPHDVEFSEGVSALLYWLDAFQKMIQSRPQQAPKNVVAFENPDAGE